MADDLFGALDLLKRRSQACLMWRDGGRFLSARARALNAKFGHRQQSPLSGHLAASQTAFPPFAHVMRLSTKTRNDS